MPIYKEAYLEKHFDDFDFFDPQCRDQRVREVNMRSKRCLSCPGYRDPAEVASGEQPKYDLCRTHPEYWLAGQMERWRINENL